MRKLPDLALETGQRLRVLGDYIGQEQHKSKTAASAICWSFFGFVL